MKSLSVCSLKIKIPKIKNKGKNRKRQTLAVGLPFSVSLKNEGYKYGPIVRIEEGRTIILNGCGSVF